MKTQPIILLLWAILLTGCVTTANQLVWYNPTKTLAEAEHDLRMAQYDATKYGYVAPSMMGDPLASGFAAGLQAGFRKNEIVSGYMQSRGYRLVRRSEFPSLPPTGSSTRAVNTQTGSIDGGIQPFVYYHEGDYLEILAFSAKEKEYKGLRIGDRILKIDEVQVSSMSMGDVFRHLTGNIGDKRKLLILNKDGTQNEIEIQLVPDSFYTK